MPPKKKHQEEEEEFDAEAEEEEEEEEGGAAPWEEGGEDEGGRRSSTRGAQKKRIGEEGEEDKSAAAAEGQQDGDEEDEEEEDRPSHERRERIISQYGEAKQMKEISGDQVTVEWLRTGLSEPVLVKEGDKAGMQAPSQVDPKVLDKHLGTSPSLSLLNVDSQQGGEEEKTPADYATHLAQAENASELKEVNAGEASLVDTHHEHQFTPPPAVHHLDLSRLAWPDQEGANPYKEQRLELCVLPKGGFFDPLPAYHGAAVWQRVVSGQKRVVVFPPEWEERELPRSATLSAGDGMMVPAAWQTAEIADEHTVSTSGSFYLLASIGQHTRQWNQDKRTEEEESAGAFRALAWCSAAIAAASLEPESGEKGQIQGAPSLGNLMANEPLGGLTQRELTETNTLITTLHRWLKSKTRTHPQPVEDPNAFLADVKGRIKRTKEAAKAKRKAQKPPRPEQGDEGEEDEGEGEEEEEEEEDADHGEEDYEPSPKSQRTGEDEAEAPPGEEE